MSYYVFRGLGVVGHFDTALLVGNMTANVDAFSSFPGLLIGSPQPIITQLFRFGADSSTRLVPVVDAKLGLDYTMLFPNFSGSDLTLEVGYQTSNYYNSIDKVTGAATLLGSSITGHGTSDLGLNGPYASLTVHAPNL